MVTENRQSLCGSNVRWKTVPESTASSGNSTITMQSSEHDLLVTAKLLIGSRDMLMKLLCVTVKLTF